MQCCFQSVSQRLSTFCILLTRIDQTYAEARRFFDNGLYCTGAATDYFELGENGTIFAISANLACTNLCGCLNGAGTGILEAVLIYVHGAHTEP